jgi:hypothetical protein
MERPSSKARAKQYTLSLYTVGIKYDSFFVEEGQFVCLLRSIFTSRLFSLQNQMCFKGVFG